MPEYLTPGVYVEETTFRTRSIEGVPINTVGMTGATEYGPWPYVAEGVPPMLPTPALVTSFTEYERAYGGLTIGDEPCQLALAARAFFSNGGRRLYVARVFSPSMTDDAEPVIDVPENFAALPVPADGDPLVTWRARWPGSSGGRIKVTVEFRRSKNVLVANPLRLTGVRPGAAVEVVALDNGRPPATKDDVPPQPGSVRIVAEENDVLGYEAADGSFEPVAAGMAAFHITLAVTVRLGDRMDVYNELELGRRREPDHRRSIFKVLEAADPADEFSLVWLDRVEQQGGQDPSAGELLTALLTLGDGGWLTGGGDGVPLSAADLDGNAADPDDINAPAHGLFALDELEDISIVAMPDTVTLDESEQKTAVDALIGHCERMRYRMAIVDPPAESSISEVRRFRSQFDTKYAALYYPWLRIVDPTKKPDPGMPPPMMLVPPSGAVAGIYTRVGAQRGVHKAPANEVILGIQDFETNVTFDRQAVLNPEGINALRFFEGRANRVWGARTMSSDPEWKYVNVRRLFNYLEASIDRSTQWAVFEPNNEGLWSSIRQTIEDFLLGVWKDGALMGTKPDQAYFVRCDRTTMTQNDLDNGRLICLIGVAPTYPAEFVIFRIGQWTADARRN